MPTKVAAAPSKHKVRLTKLFIDNKWVEPVDGGEPWVLECEAGTPVVRIVGVCKAAS